ncbi:hypothetical protein [Collimonas fungivorans]|uniref:hypothetical protein n=1 Tax=Collimonas fungivorans TaxID=158899 RepID=UPI003FA3C1A1
MAIQVLSVSEIDEVSGGITNVEGAGLGLGMIGLGIGIVAGPVGWFGVGVAVGLSYLGGALLGTGLQNELGGAGSRTYRPPHAEQ